MGKSRDAVEELQARGLGHLVDGEDWRLLQGLTADERRAVLGAARLKGYAPGDLIFEQGRPASHLYMVASGRVKLATTDSEGRQTIIRFMRPGDPIAAVAVLKEGSRYPVSALAADPTELLAWPSAEGRALLQRSPTLAQNLMQAMSSFMRDNLAARHEVSTEPVPERLAATLCRLARDAGEAAAEGVRLADPVTRQELAEMAGTTLYTVSRILNQWEEQGLVTVGRRRIVIRRLDLLEEYAGH